ncbi:MAG: MBL fold metallo-hydrolase, partial [Candidatus Marinimicrobia bacterium]|nr:MBL fold metallo-hydrolase [Candidatus Neomarinimicrobiota bacterium]
MIRTFQPIGQGAFYTEQFNGFTIVYDCGSKNESLIKKEIKSVFEKGEDIEAVFISHLHSDHINGLEFLLEFCNVKKILMPLLTENEKIQLLIQNEIIQKGISSFLENLIETQTIENVSVVLVPETESDTQINLDQESNQIDGSITSDTFKTNPKLSHSSIVDWVFIP